MTSERAVKMANASSDGVLVMEHSGMIVAVNEKLAEMFGWDQTELLGQPIERLIPKRHEGAHRADRTGVMAEPLERSTGVDLDLCALHRDGSEFPVQISLKPISDRGDDAVVATVRDITNQLALDRRTRRVHAAFNASRNGIFVFDLETLRFIDANKGATQQTGYDHDELLAMTPPGVGLKVTTSSLMKMLEPVAAGELQRTVEVTTLIAKNGEQLHVEATFECPVISDDGTRVGVMTTRDITEQLASARRIEASEQAFRTAFDEGPVGMITARLNAEGSRVIDRVNNYFCTMLGYSATQLVGADLIGLTHPDDLAADFEAAAAMRTGNKAQYVTEKRYLHADGHYVWALLHSTLLGVGSDSIVLAHILDITDRREAEAERDRQQRWLQGLAKIRTQLLSNSSVDDTLDLICQEATFAVAADVGAVAFHDEERAELDIAALHGSLASSVDVSSVILPDSLLDVMKTGMVKVAEVESGTPQTKIAAGINEVAAAPFEALDPDDSGRPGLLLLGRRSESGPFAATDLQLVESFAQQAAAAVELAQSRIATERLHRLGDRERIGQDLHDTVIQRLFAIGMSLQGGLASPDRAVLDQRVHQAVSDIDNAIRELRTAIFGLSTLDEPDSLADQLADTVTEWTDQLGFVPHLTIGNGIDATPVTIAEQLIPSLNEALSNVARHAEANAVAITVEISDGHVVLEVIDDGRGLDPHLVAGHGTENLQRRAQRLHGSCDLRNGNEGGVTLQWRAPLRAPLGSGLAGETS